MATSYHICLDIAGALNRRSLNFLQDDDGNFLSTKEAKRLLKEEQSLGKKYFTGTACDNQSEEGKCLGHPSTEND